ncbi:MAG: hypothetical protein H6Q00_2936 [Holophagaceae bacterium]|nr:hypothetical protein [Holophagaceae bacterium]
MPAAYTHAYIAHLILERIGAGIQEPDGAIRVALPATRQGAASVRLPRATVELLLGQPASFCFGATSPDFFADVLTGITSSHQPFQRKRNLAQFMTTFSASVRWEDHHQVAWLLGWFCHLCADVFGHHWVGTQSGGNFLSWFTTPPEVVRKHLGIEMVWADQVREGTGQDFLQGYILREFGRPISYAADTEEAERAFLFQRSLVLEAMLTDGAPLCEDYYDLENVGDAPVQDRAQVIHPLIRVRGWRSWHTKEKEKIQKLRGWNNSFLGRIADFDLPRLSRAQLDGIHLDCPLCKAHGLLTSTVEAACPTCAGTGFVERVALGLCPICNNEGQARVACASCEGLPDALRDLCPDCHGEREMDLPCPGCGLVKFGANEVRNRCSHCKGAGVIREHLDEACPFCKGQRALEEVLGDPRFSSQDLVNLICDRLIIYHEARRQRIDRLVDTYQEAHERLALLLLNASAPGAQAVMDCFSTFLSEVSSFALSALTFSDLVPELSAYKESVKKSIEDIFDLFLDLVPDAWIETLARLRQEVLDKAFGVVSDYLGSPMLTDAEEQAVKRVLAGYHSGALVWRRRTRRHLGPVIRRVSPPLLFAPVADAVTLFLLALQGQEPTKGGLTAAFQKLGDADNIDAQAQPTRVSFYQDLAFPWDDRFRLVGRDRAGEEGLLVVQG